MKMVSLFFVLLLTWAAFSLLDLPSASASPGVEEPPPAGEILSEPGEDATEGDPDDIIEGNRGTGSLDGGEPEEKLGLEFEATGLMRRVAEYLRFVIWL